MKHFHPTILMAIIVLFPGDVEQDHPHRDRDLLRIIIHTEHIYLYYLKIISMSLLVFFSQSSFLTLCSHSPFLSLCQKRPDFTRDHTGCDCEACFRRLPAVGGSGGLGNCHLCDYPVGTVGSFLHPQDAAQPSTHIHLPVWIGKDAPEFVSDFLN